MAQLGTLFDNKFDTIKSLSQTEYDEYFQNWQVINEACQDRSYMEMVDFNYQDFFTNVKAYQKTLNAQSKIEYKNSYEFRNNVNRVFLNYLASVLTLIDHSKTSLKRRYGNESYQSNQFEKFCSHLFDNCFEYRFFYKLRNYAQHIAPPIQSISNKFERNNTPQWTIEIKFNMKQLASSYDGWGAIVRRDLEEYNSRIEVNTLMQQHFSLIGNLYSEIQKIKEPKIVEAIEFMRMLTSTKKGEYPGHFIMITNEEHRGRVMNLSWQTVPLYRIWYIREGL